MKKEPYPKAGAAPSIFMFCVLRGDYSRRVSLMISSNVSPKRSAAEKNRKSSQRTGGKNLPVRCFCMLD